VKSYPYTVKDGQ